MGPDRSKHIRNALIIVVLAVIYWKLPGGRTGGATVSNLLSIILLGGLCFFAYRMYQERRITLLDMEDRTRMILYGSFALLAFAIVATGRLWATGGPGALIWLGLVGLAGYGMYSVYRSEREY